MTECSVLTEPSVELHRSEVTIALSVQTVKDCF